MRVPSGENTPMSPSISLICAPLATSHNLTLVLGSAVRMRVPSGEKSALKRVLGTPGSSLICSPVDTSQSDEGPQQPKKMRLPSLENIVMYIICFLPPST